MADPFPESLALRRRSSAVRPAPIFPWSRKSWRSGRGRFGPGSLLGRTGRRPNACDLALGFIILRTTFFAPPAFQGNSKGIGHHGRRDAPSLQHGSPSGSLLQAAGGGGLDWIGRPIRDRCSDHRAYRIIRKRGRSQSPDHPTPKQNPFLWLRPSSPQKGTRTRLAKAGAFLSERWVGCPDTCVRIGLGKGGGRLGSGESLSYRNSRMSQTTVSPVHAGQLHLAANSVTSNSSSSKEGGIFMKGGVGAHSISNPTRQGIEYGNLVPDQCGGRTVPSFGSRGSHGSSGSYELHARIPLSDLFIPILPGSPTSLSL